MARYVDWCDLIYKLILLQTMKIVNEITVNS
jgi:hypothetical protein